MKQARVLYQDQLFQATEEADALRLDNDELVSFEQVQWLPPLAPISRPRTILCLGLNYRDHAAELAFKPPSEPLAFLKGQSSLIGHDAHTLRPAEATHMHYECELAVVIGRKAKDVQAADAHTVIGGYTIANDYAIRDYLENWYRPNLKVKGRPTCTPIGPWLVSAQALKKQKRDPANLVLETKVNGVVTQRGNTQDMIFSVPYLIEYFSSFMTLQPGDLILTGTPDGVVDCKVGDVVECSIEGLGILKNTIATL